MRRRCRCRDCGGPAAVLVPGASLCICWWTARVKLCGAGEWLLEKHGTKTHRLWRTLHLGVDAATGQIVAATPTDKHMDDASQVDPVLDQVVGAVASFIGDGAYDQDRVYASVIERHPQAAVVVPPRSTAVPSEAAESAPHTARPPPAAYCRVPEYCRMVWQTTSGYSKLSWVEAAISR